MPGIGVGVGVGIIAGAPVSARSATPLTILGSLLVGWWDAGRSDLITHDGSNLVSSWKDVIGGYDLTQGTAGAKPVYSATSFGSRPGVTFDGADDYLRLASTPASFPVGNATSEIWLCGDQTIDKAVATSVNAFTYGATTHSRAVRRTVASADNRANVTASGASASNTNGVWFGRHYVRGIFVDGAINPHLDGVAGSNGAATLATTASSITMGANNSSTAGSFFGGVIDQVLVLNAAPTADQVTALNTYFAARL